MKKICKVFALTVVFILCCFCPTGCSDGFRMVKSVTITTGGETKNFSTSMSPIVEMGNVSVYDLIEDPTAEDEEEFANAPEERKFYDVAGEKKKEMTNQTTSKLSKISFKEAVKAAKGDIHYEIVEPELEGYYYIKTRYTPNGNTYYFKTKYVKTSFNFVYVKIKNNTTIVIKAAYHGETTYQVTSYKIIKL